MAYHVLQMLSSFKCSRSKARRIFVVSATNCATLPPMLWLWLILRMKPRYVRVRTLHTFAATNPWRTNQTETWTLELFRTVLLPKNSREEIAIPSVESGVPVATGIPAVLKNNERLGLRADSDGALHIIPVTWADVLRQQPEAIVALPHLLHQVGPLKPIDLAEPWRHKLLMGLALFLMALPVLLGALFVVKHRELAYGDPWMHALHAMLITAPFFLMGLVFLLISFRRLRRMNRLQDVLREHRHRMGPKT